MLSSTHLLKYLEIFSAMIGSFRWIIFVWSGSHIKMANKLVLVDKEEVNYTAKTSSYSSTRFIWDTCILVFTKSLCFQEINSYNFYTSLLISLISFFNILSYPWKVLREKVLLKFSLFNLKAQHVYPQLTSFFVSFY